jgi:hypothetical protein
VLAGKPCGAGNGALEELTMIPVPVPVPVELKTTCLFAPNAVLIAPDTYVADACGERECAFCQSHHRTKPWGVTYLPGGASREATRSEVATQAAAIERAQREASLAAKGGTHTIAYHEYRGTSTAARVAEEARRLAAEGFEVFVLDLEVTMPAVHFELLDDEGRKGLCPGFVEMAHDYVHKLFFPEIEGHCMTTHGVRFMPAGLSIGGDYWKKLSDLDWQKLFTTERGDGVPLFVALKELIEQTYAPDYLLIAAPGGITEIGGGVFQLLADEVRLLPPIDKASEWGTREAIRAMQISPRLLDTALAIVEIH